MHPDPVKNAFYNPSDFRSARPEVERSERTLTAASRKGFRATRARRVPHWLLAVFVAILVGSAVYLGDRLHASRALPLPASGELQRFYAPAEPARAPFQISAAQVSEHYLVKLEDWRTGAPVVTVFVRKGEVASVQVPVGVYRLKYVSGRYWRGPRALFGPLASAREAREPLVFQRNGDQYQGHVVDLLPRLFGNLKSVGRPVQLF